MPRHVKPTEYQLTYFSLPSNVSVLVVGPQSLINNLTGLGLPSSAIRLVSPVELSSTPNGSVIIIDWNYVNKTMHMNYDELAKALENPMGRYDLVIVISEDPSEVMMLEETVAVAWGNYYRSRVIGFSVFPVNSSSYILGFGGAGLMIAVIPINQVERLRLLMRTWYNMAYNTSLSMPIYVRLNTVINTTNQDPCYYIAVNYGRFLINNQYGWLFWTGPQTIITHHNGLQSAY